MKYILVGCSGIATLLYAYLWYNDAKIPAWSALMWCAIVFIEDLAKALQE